uniref:Zona pellucida sperm-binding protein 3 n=1 Tax=Monopterus albus TaxID=43700 RepID=A0A3Q3Q3M6_MONAL
MSPSSVVFLLFIWSKLATVQCYTYQTEPLSLSYVDLAALEANSFAQTKGPNSYSGDPLGITDHKVKTLVVKCHEDSVEVVMKAHLFGPGWPVDPAHLRLGLVGAAQSQCRATVSGRGEYVIRAPLTDCGSFTHNAVLYNNLLLYSPPPTSPRDRFHMEGAAIPVHCEYKRSLKPTWTPLISVRSAHLSLDFQLRLMTNDWSSERKSSVYFLDEMVNIEASVDHRRRHLPLRLYVNSCVATLSSDVTSYPRYPFVDHQGCFTDSKLNGSSSRFLTRFQDNHLQLQLQPFLFHQDHRRTIYMTCYLEAEPISNKDPEKKACSFTSGRWRSVDGDDHICVSCDQINNSSSVKSSHKRALRSTTNRQHGNAPNTCTSLDSASIKTGSFKSTAQILP